MTKKLKKFTTFEDLKSYKTESIDDASKLKIHEEFEKFIKKLVAGKIKKLTRKISINKAVLFNGCF